MKKKGRCMKKRKNMLEENKQALNKKGNDIWETLKETRKKPRIDDSQKAEKDLETVMDAMIEKFKEKEESEK